MASLKTELCDRLGLEVPIVQAPMGSAACPALASSVANAGGLGMLSVTWKSAAQIRDEIRRTRALTDRPFGVNIVLGWDPEERIEAVLAEGIRLVSFFWGDPSVHISRVHAAGALVALTVGTAAEARDAVAAGVDIVVAQGWEAGGHVWGQVATFPLVPAVVDAVRPVPVMAAGGIADGRGVAAALCLGAQAAWVGTRLLASEEADVHPDYKRWLIEASEASTVHTELYDGGWPHAPHRVLENDAIKRWVAAGRPEPGHRPDEHSVVASQAGGEPVELYSVEMPLPGMSGELHNLALYAGQSTGLVREILPAGAILRQLAEEALLTLESFSSIPAAQGAGRADSEVRRADARAKSE